MVEWWQAEVFQPLSLSLSVPSIWLQGYRQIIGFTQQHLTYTLLTLGLAWPHMDMLPIIIQRNRCILKFVQIVTMVIIVMKYGIYLFQTMLLYKVLLCTDFSVTLSAVYIVTPVGCDI